MKRLSDETQQQQLKLRLQLEVEKVHLKREN
jgi:hypothetical protein